MRRAGALIALALSLWLALIGVHPAASGSTPSPRADRPGVVIEITPPSVSTRVGDHFSFTTTVRNDGAEPLDHLVAHLNILSLDPSVYVDPEDWSSTRTRYLPVLPPGHTTTISWSVQSVNTGHFLLYVAVASQAGSDAVAASPVLRATIASRRTLNPAGILPVALAVPAVLLALWGVQSMRRRRTMADVTDPPELGER